MQLLKAAKLNTARADPFTPLDLWYETENDLKRAFRCNSKALLLDGDNSIPDRGFLRLKPYDVVECICENLRDIKLSILLWAPTQYSLQML